MLGGVVSRYGGGWKLGSLVYTLGTGVSGSLYGDARGYGGGANLTQVFADSPTTTAPGFKMSVAQGFSISVGATSSSSFIGFGASVSASGVSNCYTRLSGISLQVLPSGIWRFSVDLVEFFAGSLIWSGGPFARDSGYLVCPANIPSIGCFPVMDASAYVGYTHRPSRPPADPAWVNSGGAASTSSVGSMSGLGGGMALIGGSGGVLTLTASESVDATWETEHRVKTSNTALMVPDMPRGVVRLNDDYEAVWSRMAFPQIDRVVQVDTASVGGGTSTVINSYPSYPAESQFLATVGNGAHVIEDPITRGRELPRQVTSSDNTNVHGDVLESYGTVTTTTVGPNLGSQTGMAANLKHPNWTAAYTNTWGHPLWSFGLFFPSDGDATTWPGFSGAAWRSLRQQYTTHPSLPPAEKTLHRVDVVAEPIDQNGLEGVFFQAFGYKGCWVGISRFELWNEAALTSVTTDASSGARWTFVGGTGTVGATIVPGAGVTAVEFALADFVTFPYMVTSWATAVTVGWTGFTTCDVFLVGADGTKRKLGSVAGTFALPVGDTARWAGSWAHDFGAGVLADTYSVIPAKAASDDSLVVLGSATRASNFGLLPSRSGAKLRFEITGTGTIIHPRFDLPASASMKAFATVARHGDILVAGGSHQRYGATSFFNYPGDVQVNPPQVEPSVNFAPTIGDMLAWGNEFRLGQSAFAGLLVTAGNYFLNGIEFAAGKDLWRTPVDLSLLCHSVFLNSSSGVKGVMVNGFRECPPLCLLPRLARDGDLLETGAVVGTSYSFVQKNKYVVTAGTQIVSVPSGLAIPAPVGWSVVAWVPQVTNFEGYDAWLTYRGEEWCKVRPWRGYFGIFAPGRSLAAWCGHDFFGAYHACLVKADGSLEHQRAAFSFPPFVESHILWNSVLDAKFAFAGDDGSTLCYAVTDAAGVKYGIGHDDGATLQAPYLLLPGSMHGDISINTFGFQLVSGSQHISGTSGPVKIVVKRMNLDRTWSGPFTVALASGPATAFADATFHISATPEGNWVLCAIRDGEATPSSFVSTDDGESWSLA